MQDPGERVAIDPAATLAADGAVVAGARPSLAHPSLMPLRAALLVLSAIVGGVALSFLLGAAPAHAADGDGLPTPVAGLIGDSAHLVSTSTSATTEAAATAVTTAASTLDTTVSTTVTTVVPPVQTLVQATGETVTTVAPIVAPVAQPVVAVVTGTLTGAVQVLGPIHQVVWTVAAASHPLDGPSGRAPAGRAPAAAAIGVGAASGVAALVPSPTSYGDADGTLPDPLLVSSAGSLAAALGALLLVLAPALLLARRRLDDDALPLSPVFDTDTSPA